MLAFSKANKSAGGAKHLQRSQGRVLIAEHVLPEEECPAGLQDPEYFAHRAFGVSD